MAKKGFGIKLIGFFFILWAAWCSKGILSNPETAFSSLAGFILFLILGIGILKFNNKARMIAVTYTAGIAVAGPLGLIYSFFLTDKEVHNQVISKYGIFVEIYPWLFILPISILCLCCVVYLTRPSVREMFKKP